jgi:threonine aldolase
MTADEICLLLQDRGVLASGFGSSIRMVTHYDVSRDDMETTLNEFKSILGKQEARSRNSE